MSEVHADSSPKRWGGRLRFAIAAAIIVCAAGAGFLVWRAHQAYHFAVVTPGVLYRDGARSRSQLAAALDQARPRTVVSLVDAAEQADPRKPQFAEEAKLCDARGIQLHRIEVKLGGWPHSGEIQDFLNVVSDRANQPVLVHCAQGVRRTAFFVAAYQESILGFDPTQAKGAILTFGHSDSTVRDIKRFIDDYDPKGRTVSPDLK